jgi:hypothetical protein
MSAARRACRRRLSALPLPSSRATETRSSRASRSPRDGGRNKVRVGPGRVAAPGRSARRPADGTPAEPSSVECAAPNWGPGATIHFGHESSARYTAKAVRPRGRGGTRGRWRSGSETQHPGLGRSSGVKVAAIVRPGAKVLRLEWRAKSDRKSRDREHVLWAPSDAGRRPRTKWLLPQRSHEQGHTRLASVSIGRSAYSAPPPTHSWARSGHKRPKSGSWRRAAKCHGAETNSLHTSHFAPLGSTARPTA